MKPIPDMSLQELQQACWQLKKMIRFIGELYMKPHLISIGPPTDRKTSSIEMAAAWSEGELPWQRASGNAICPKCGLEYFDHPAVFEHILHLACDGRLLKL